MRRWCCCASALPSGLPRSWCAAGSGPPGWTASCPRRSGPRSGWPWQPFPFWAIVAYYRAEATVPPAVRWINFGYTDKRWETYAFLLGAIAPLLFLVVAAGVLRAGRHRPASWRAWLRGMVPAGSTVTGPAALTRGAAGDAEPVPAWRRSRAARIFGVSAGMATMLGLAYYFLGPPWYLDHTGAPIGYQEDVFLVGFQAIAKGHLPYIGVAGVQYGPGTQLVSYWFMRHVASFSVVGFRESWALFQWVGASVLFVVFFLAFGYARGLAASLLCGLIYPTLHQVAFQAGGTFNGFWAWASPLRYVGAIMLIVLLPAAIARCPSWRGVAGGVTLGFIWGVMSYMAQENLVAGAAGALLVSVLLLFSGTFSWPAVRAGLAAVLAGFLLVCLPVLGFYAAHGDLGRFLQLYFLSPRAVAEGYSNTPWQGASHQPSPLTTMFYALPFVLALLAPLAAVRFRPFRIATEWSRDRAVLVAVLLTTILLYQGALFRSDTSHLTATLLAVPGVVIMTGAVLPGLLGGRRRLTLIGAGTAIIAASFALLPQHAFSWPSVRSAAERPYLDRQKLAADHSTARPATVAAERVGAGLTSAPFCCQHSPVPMGGLIDAMNRLHAIIGNRTTYVVYFRDGYPGLVYFLADLRPAPVQLDKYTSVLNEPQLAAYLAYFRASVLPRTEALVTTTVQAPEARYFLQRFPRARRVLLRYGGKPYYALLRQG